MLPRAREAAGTFLFFKCTAQQSDTHLIALTAFFHPFPLLFLVPQVSIYFHDLGINMGDYALDMSDAAARLSPEHSISIFLTSNPVFLASALEEL